MADTVTSQTLQDGLRNAVMRFTNQSDGTGKSAVTKVDVSALTADVNGTACSEVSIEKIEYSTSGMSVDILFDATTDVLAATLPADTAGELPYRDIGGVPNNSSTGKTGDIKFTTRGQLSGDTYTVTIWMKKKYG